MILKKYSPLGRNLYICTELCGEPFPGIGSADVYHRHGKGDRCIRGREKGCSGPGDFRGVRGTSGGTPDGTKRVREKGMVPLLKYKNLDYLESLVCPGSYGRRCGSALSFFVAGRGEGSIQGNLSEACPVCCHISRKSDGSIVIKRKPASYNSLRNRTRRMR